MRKIWVLYLTDCEFSEGVYSVYKELPSVSQLMKDLEDWEFTETHAKELLMDQSMYHETNGYTFYFRSVNFHD